MCVLTFTLWLIGNVLKLLFREILPSAGAAVSSEVVGEPMEVITDKPSLACEEPVVKDLLPNSLVSNNASESSSQQGDDNSMQVDDEITSSGDTLEEKDRLTM